MILGYRIYLILKNTFALKKKQKLNEKRKKGNLTKSEKKRKIENSALNIRIQKVKIPEKCFTQYFKKKDKQNALKHTNIEDDRG